MIQSNPYKNLPRRNFWKPSVAEVSPFGLTDLYRKKFEISSGDRIAAAGSCFAQHIAKRLKRAGYNFLDVDPPPFNMPTKELSRFGYELYSARFGNIYTARQLLQLAKRASGLFSPEEAVWEKNGRFFDPFRPTIEPDGFLSIGEYERAYSDHLNSVRKLLELTEVFVFTLGLTEAWVDRRDGSTYPMVPGSSAGTFDSSKYEFRNFTCSEILADMREFIALARELRPGMKFILTVSPVPLIATATDHHVLVATTYSKSVLRTVAGEIYQTDMDVDYFPSFEIICGLQAKSVFFEPDLRNVHPLGVDVVMDHFFSQHEPLGEAQARTERAFINEGDVVCDEVVLAQEVVG